MSLKFFYNGIKGSDGKLQGADYSLGGLWNSPTETITIYGKRYRDFSKEIHEAFVVINNSDCQSDYFEQDHIRVEPSHPLYQQVKAAYLKQKAHYDAVLVKRKAKYQEVA